MASVEVGERREGQQESGDEEEHSLVDDDVGGVFPKCCSADERRRRDRRVGRLRGRRALEESRQVVDDSSQPADDDRHTNPRHPTIRPQHNDTHVLVSDVTIQLDGTDQEGQFIWPASMGQLRTGSNGGGGTTFTTSAAALEAGHY